MLAIEHEPARYAEWFEYIESATTKEAFCLMVGLAACTRGISCRAQLKGAKGPIHDFRFIDKDQKQPFSFITNKNSLLFYFRAPAVGSGTYSLAALQIEFPNASENERGEWKVSLKSIENVRRLWQYLALQ